MASVSVRGNKINIDMSGVDPILAGQLIQLIGTAHQSEADPNLVRCRCSIPNFQRIKRIMPGIKLADDEQTKAAVKKLKAAEEAWVKENERIRAVKAGREEGLFYNFQFQPYKHQRVGFSFMHACPRGAVFGDCGIGKTAITAAFVDSLIQRGEISVKEPALIICPISIIQQAWIKDFAKFTPVVPISLYEPSMYKRKQKQAARYETKSPVYITSFSQLRLNEKRLREKRFKFIAIDESTKIKNPNTATFRALMKIAWKAKYRYVMSGTPAPNGPIDLWSQFFFLDDGMTLEPSLVDFRHTYYTRIDIGDNAGFWVPKRGMEAHINKMIEPRAVRFKSSECLDLPEQTFLVREVEATGPQRRIYDEMANNLFAELDDGETVTARVIVSKIMKLREITGGFVIDDSRTEKPIGKNPKMDELDLLLDQALASEDHKAIVWISYRWEARAIINRYKKRYGAAGLYGDVSQKQKDKNVDNFLESPKHRLLVCHPQSAAHGLTLTAASYSIYYSLSHNFEDYYQSSMRIHRPGQKRPTFYYFLTMKDTIDKGLLQCIQKKKNVQDVLIDGSLDPHTLLGIRQ